MLQTLSVEEIIAQTNRDLLNAIVTQPASMQEVLAHLRAQMNSSRVRELLANAEMIFLTGCGDSFYAGLAAQQFFLRHAGIFTQAIEAMEYSRYVGHYAPRNSLVIAVSNSGRVSRTIEAAQLSATRHGGSIGVTDAPDSGLARAAAATVSVGLTPMASGATGTRSYLASLFALYVLGITAGETKGTLGATEATALHRRLDESIEAIEWTVEHSRAAVQNLIPLLQSEAVLYFLGAGPNYATANYGAAKLLEALALSGVAVQMEEWAHEQFHIAGPDTTFVVLAPRGNGRDRILEQLAGLNDMRARVIVVAPHDDAELRAASPFFIPVAGTLPEELSPIEMCIPLQFLAVFLAVARHTTMRMLTDEQKRDVNFRQIFSSAVRAQ